MRAPLSIVIPTLNSERHLPATLASLMEGVAHGLIREVVVSDGGSTDHTLEIAKETGGVLVTGPASRGGQLRRGASAAAGEWLLFLHSDTRLAEGWCDAATAFFSTPEVVGYGRLSFSEPSAKARLVARGANLRSRFLGLPYGDQGLLINREVYAEIGGYSDVPLMEDVKLARALRGRLRPAGFTAITSAERYTRDGYAKRVLRNWSILTRYCLGASPETLARDYSGSST